MPFVQVWVDEGECDGDCEAAREADALEAKIQEAERLLRMGYADAALHALTGDPAMMHKSPAEISAQYQAWKEGRLDGFIPPEQNRAGT